LHALSDCRLYAILDLAYVKAADAGGVVAKMLEGGVDLIQLRAKGDPLAAILDLAAGLHAVTCRSSTPFIVNDHAAVAAKVQVEGIHVGQDDDPIAVAREKAGRAIIVGKSTHSVEQAINAQREGADYIGFGPIFATPTKPDYAPIGLGDIKRVHAEVSLPIFCIGGINIDNLQQVIDAGAKRAVMVSALLRAHNIVDYARCATDMLA
jgi:thiamine-phosphate pyrophosphorylase